MTIGEFELIRRFFSRPASRPGVIVGVGDDGAVLQPEPGRELVAVVDTLVEGVHYPPRLAGEDVGYRALAVNLSDVAAMGASPRWMTLALTLTDADETWLEAFADGLYTAAALHDVALVGGDTTRGTQTVVSVNLLAEVEPGTALIRSGARVGDDVWLSGTTGEAAAGLRLLLGSEPDRPGGEALIERFRRPAPRLSLGQALRGTATAAIDVSDGLHDDLGKLLAASGVGATLEVERIPLADNLVGLFPDEALAFALAGGDDYELCFTAPPTAADRVARAGGEARVRVTRIGRVVDGQGIECLDEGRPFDLEPTGFDHFGGAA